MTCVVLSFPRAKKRGRKTKNGLKATVTLLYELAEPANRNLCEADNLADLIAEKMRARQESWKAFLAENPQVIEFPDTRRYRTVHEIRSLEERAERARKKARGKWTPLMEEMQRIAVEIGAEARRRAASEPAGDGVA